MRRMIPAIATLTLILALAGCGRVAPTSPVVNRGASSSAAKAGAAPSANPAAFTRGEPTGGSLNGRAGTMPAFYDDNQLTINFMELPPDGEAQVLANNPSVNTIYMSDAGLPGGAPFISVLDAIQGDGFNPLWREAQISFTSGHTPRQLTSDTDVDAAKASGEITVSFTDEIYRCSVVGTK